MKSMFANWASHVVFHVMKTIQYSMWIECFVRQASIYKRSSEKHSNKNYFHYNDSIKARNRNSSCELGYVTKHSPKQRWEKMFDWVNSWVIKMLVFRGICSLLTFAVSCINYPITENMGKMHPWNRNIGWFISVEQQIFNCSLNARR